MSQFRYLLLFLMIAVLPAWAQPTTETPQGEAELRRLGSINGVALHCGYVGQVRRIKSAIIETVPKQRHYGALFEQATHEGFLEFVEARRPCPTEVTVAADVDAAVERLLQAFP